MMRNRFLVFLLALFGSLAILLSAPKEAYALISCSDYNVSVVADKAVYSDGDTVKLTVTINDGKFRKETNPNLENYIAFIDEIYPPSAGVSPSEAQSKPRFHNDPSKTTQTYTFDVKHTSTWPVAGYFLVLKQAGAGFDNSICQGPKIRFYPTRLVAATCKFDLPTEIKVGTTYTTPIVINDTGSVNYSVTILKGPYEASQFGITKGTVANLFSNISSADQLKDISLNMVKKELTIKDTLPIYGAQYTAVVVASLATMPQWAKACMVNKFKIVATETTNDPRPGDAPPGGDTSAPGFNTPSNQWNICDVTPEKCSKASGLLCDLANPIGADGKINRGKADGVMTAIGCVPTEPMTFIQGVMRVATGIGGAIALLLMIGGSIQMMTSAGSPEGVKKGRDQFASAAIGLMFILFSVLLLQVIGVDLLGLPGFVK